jgi:CBS domain-containing protein
MKGRGREMKGMKVREVLEAIGRREPPVISDDATIQEVVESMCNCQHSRAIYVVDKDNKLLGTIPLETLMRHIFSHSHERHAHPRHLLGIITTESAKDLMNKKPIHASEEEDVEIVLERMVGKRVSEIAIVGDAGKIIADLTMLDLLKVCR